MERKTIISKINSLNDEIKKINDKILDIMDKEICLKERLRDLHRELNKEKFNLSYYDNLKK